MTAYWPTCGALFHPGSAHVRVSDALVVVLALVPPAVNASGILPPVVSACDADQSPVSHELVARTCTRYVVFGARPEKVCSVVTDASAAAAKLLEPKSAIRASYRRLAGSLS